MDRLSDVREDFVQFKGLCSRKRGMKTDGKARKGEGETPGRSDSGKKIARMRRPPHVPILVRLCPTGCWKHRDLAPN